MNINQQQQCLANITELEELNFEEIILNFYSGENDLRKIVFAKYNSAEFLELFNRMLSQLKFELTEGLQGLKKLALLQLMKCKKMKIK